jgi:hypothetical protein
MFIATSEQLQISLQQRETWRRNDCQSSENAIAAPLELRNKGKDRQAINISPRWGEATNNVSVAFEVELTH